MSNEELKPCPIPACRSIDVVIDGFEIDDWGEIRVDWLIKCNTCGIGTGFMSGEKKDAVSFWNALSLPPIPTEPVGNVERE